MPRTSLPAPHPGHRRRRRPLGPTSRTLLPIAIGGATHQPDAPPHRDGQTRRLPHREDPGETAAASGEGRGGSATGFGLRTLRSEKAEAARQRWCGDRIGDADATTGEDRGGAAFSAAEQARRGWRQRRRGVPVVKQLGIKQG